MPRTKESKALYRKLGSALRFRRILLGYSQVELGKSLGVSFQQIQKYERGDDKIPIHRYLEACRLLSINPWELLEFNKVETLEIDKQLLTLNRMWSSLSDNAKQNILSIAIALKGVR